MHNLGLLIFMGNKVTYMPRQHKQTRFLFTALLAVSFAATGCGGQKIQGEQGKTPIEGPMSFEREQSNVTRAQRQELLSAIREAEQKVQHTTQRIKVSYIKNQPVHTYMDFTSKKQLHDYYAQNWSEQLATQLTHETVDLNYSIPGQNLAVNPTFRQISPLSMKLPQTRITSYYKNTAIAEYMGTVDTGQKYRIQYTLMKNNENDRWIVAHKAISQGGIGPYIGNKKER
ncbi:hypothetical protein AMI01nite_50850 [Aneurinibacillus migulanus]|nr:hypothetical protein AMI01nite_50850 [Aneurinibacillus migulanus]